MEGKQVIFDGLSNLQQKALIDIVARGGLYRSAHGYEGSLHEPHRHSTMVALAKRGLCIIKSKAGDMGAVEPTVAGRCTIASKFGDDSYGAAVAMVDSSKRRKKRSTRQ